MKSSQFVLLVLLLVSIINCQNLRNLQQGSSNGTDGDIKEPIDDIDTDSDYEELHRIIVRKQIMMKNLYDISEMNSEALSRIVRRSKGQKQIETSDISEELLEGLNIESNTHKYMRIIDAKICKIHKLC